MGVLATRGLGTGTRGKLPDPDPELLLALPRLMMRSELDPGLLLEVVLAMGASSTLLAPLRSLVWSCTAELSAVMFPRILVAQLVTPLLSKL